MTTRAKQLTNRATTTNPASLIRTFLTAFDRLGFSTGVLLDAADLRDVDFDDPDVRVPCTATEALITAAIGQRPIANLGVRLAAETPIGAFPLIDYLVVTAETVGDGLHQLARYFRLTGAPYEMNIRADESPVQVHLDGAANPFTMEFGVAIDILHLREETDGRIKFDYACFTHQPQDVAGIERILGCPVRPGALWNGFALPHDSWRLPMRRRDPVLQGLLEGQADGLVSRLPGDPVIREVRRALASLIPKAETQIQGVARSLATSVRSLQRRLNAAGVSYQELLDEARREAADRYLASSALAIGEVAYLLGYSEPAAFHRAFRRWSGMTPQAFRSRRRHAAGL